MQQSPFLPSVFLLWLCLCPGEGKGLTRTLKSNEQSERRDPYQCCVVVKTICLKTFVTKANLLDHIMVF